MCEALGSLAVWILDVDGWIQILFSRGFSLASWKAKDFVTPVWLTFCWGSPGTAFCESSRVTRDLAGTASLHQDYRNLRNIPSAHCHHSVPVSWLCWTCLHTARASHWFPHFEPKLPINRTLPISDTSPRVFAVKPSPKSQPCLMSQCLFDLCCCLAFTCYWEKGLWFPVMAAQQEEMSSWATKPLFSYMFLRHRKMRGERKANKFQSINFFPL